MNINLKNISDKMENITYEKPALTKYGTMKNLTANSSGSLVDLGRQGGDHNNPVNPRR